MYLAGQITENLPDGVAFASHARTGHPEWRLGSMVGRSVAMQRLFSQMRCTARHLRIATIEGESGTGKTLAAQTLHNLGPAAARPFIACSAAQFFQNGPLTPLATDARDGSLFLSHVEELSPDQQTRLIAFMHWIDRQQSRRTPEAGPRQLFFSSRTPLRKLALSAQFRADLSHRLTAIRFIMPPLRERRDDLALLADSFARHFSATHAKLIRGIGPQTLERLAAHHWPGNVRELQSIIQTAALDCQGQWIRPIDLPALSSAPEIHSTDENPTDEDPSLDRAILRHIHRVLARADGNKLRAAKMLGISRSTLYRLLDAASVNRVAAEAAALNSQT